MISHEVDTSEDLCYVLHALPLCTALVTAIRFNEDNEQSNKVTVQPRIQSRNYADVLIAEL